MRRRPPTKLQSLKHLHDGLISVPCRSPSSFISLSRSRPKVFGPTTGDEGDHHAANGIIGACGFERVLALDPAPRAWRVGAVRRVLVRNRKRERPKGFRPVTDDVLQKPDPGDWLMRRGDYRAWGYSALDQIRAGNVGALTLAWAWNMEPGYQEEAPLVHDGVIFLANPQNVVHALDGRTGDLLWEYRRELPKIEGGYHNDLFDRARGTIALYADKVFLASADAHVVALDARTGKVAWDTTVADYRRGYTFTS